MKDTKVHLEDYDTMVRGPKIAQYIQDHTKEMDMFSFCATICSGIYFYCQDNGKNVFKIASMIFIP